MPTISFTTPSGIIPAYSPDLPFGIMEAYTNAVGRQIQRMIGLPMTRIRQDFSLTATTLEVETTLGFPPGPSQLWISGERYSYTSVTSSTFVDVTLVTQADRTQVLGVRTEVTPYTPAVPPA
jgi:hypothetical protein